MRDFGRRAGAVVLAVVLACTVVAGCDDDDVSGPSDAPASHTVSQDGVRHLPGLGDPETNCVACHGADLLGGANGEPSCFSCHGQKW